MSLRSCRVEWDCGKILCFNKLIESGAVLIRREMEGLELWHSKQSSQLRVLIVACRAAFYHSYITLLWVCSFSAYTPGTCRAFVR